MTNLKREYQKEKNYWGDDHSKGLEEAIKWTVGKRVLDIGAGEGQNSIYLAKKGFDVLALDVLPEAGEKTKRNAKKAGVILETQTADIRDVDLYKHEYSLVVAANIFNFFRFSEFLLIIENLKKSLSLGGVFYLSVFSNKDPGFEKLKKTREEVEKNTFLIEEKGYCFHYFTREDMMWLLRGFTYISLKERQVEDTSHGKKHFHNIFELIAINYRAE